MSVLATVLVGSCLSVLVLVKCHRVVAVLVVIDPILPFLAKLEELAGGSGPLHHHLLAAAASADAGHVTLSVHH